MSDGRFTDLWLLIQGLGLLARILPGLITVRNSVRATNCRLYELGRGGERPSPGFVRDLGYGQPNQTPAPARVLRELGSRLCPTIHLAQRH